MAVEGETKIIKLLWDLQEANQGLRVVGNNMGRASDANTSVPKIATTAGPQEGSQQCFLGVVN
jgi:hypothetical protein